MTVEIIGDKEKQFLAFEDALNLVGNGSYNVALLILCGFMLAAMGADLFGSSFIVTASGCDLNMTSQQQSLFTSLPFVGIILVSYFWGYFADTRGRRRTLLWSMYTSFILSSLSSLSPNWVVMAIMKFLSVCFSSATSSATYTLLGESCSAKVRSRYILIATVFLMFALVFAALISYPVLALEFAHVIPWLGITFRPWRLLIILIALPCGLCALALHFFHESPKFLVHLGKQEEAMEVLRKIYSFNKGVPANMYPVKGVYLDENYEKKEQLKESLLSSMWQQTVPLFQPPLLFTTLKLYYLMAVIYGTNNSFVMWTPKIFNSFFSKIESRNATDLSLCNLIVDSSSTTEIPDAVCSSIIADNAIWTVVVHGTAISLLCAVLSQFYSWKKTVLITSLFASSFSGICLNLTPEPISSIIFYFIFTSSCVGIGIMSAQFVELYPTAYRGMVACLGMMVGRLSGFIGINLVGNTIFSHCPLTFYCASAFAFSGVIVACLLPANRKKIVNLNSS